MRTRLLNMPISKVFPMLVTLAAAGQLLCSQAYADPKSSANFAITRDALNNGVGDMASANFRLAAAVGDAVSTGVISSLGFRLGNGVLAQVNASSAALNLLSVVSQKIHGSTTYSLTIDHQQPISGLVTVEPRAIGAGHTLVFHFDNAVTSVNPAATALNNAISMGTATAAVVNGDVVVTLTNVADNRRLTLTISGLNGNNSGSGSAAASMGFMLGDVNNDRRVNAADISATKARAGRAPSAGNFVFDLNATGVVTAADIATVKARATGAPLSP